MFNTIALSPCLEHSKCSQEMSISFPLLRGSFSQNLNSRHGEEEISQGTSKFSGATDEERGSLPVPG